MGGVVDQVRLHGCFGLAGTLLVVMGFGLALGVTWIEPAPDGLELIVDGDSFVM